MRARTPLVALLLLAMALAGCLSEGGDGRSTPGPGAPGGPGGPSPGPAPEIEWADPEAATIRPGVQMQSPGGQCTSNFIFTSPDNATVYIGFAAHCANEGPASATSGCSTQNNPMPPGTEIDIHGASMPGVLAYNAWYTMQQRNETNQDACNYNDFALVAIHPDDVPDVNPAVLQYGGPIGLAAPDEIPQGTRVLSYGNSGLRGGGVVEPLNWKEGYVLSTHPSGWSHTVYTASPGVPGDSGSNMITSDGRALGVVVTLALLPVPGSNGVTSIHKAMEYAAEHGDTPLVLATWDLLDGGLLPESP